ncbi:zinc-dependent metalloprotease family protein [Massilia sp. TSP1-1-2]|uniref:zinc-dependent metalloprotease family protein n=1 Tax=unclassified Massilia TaxID=2609279 RepID=UPI003CE898A9
MHPSSTQRLAAAAAAVLLATAIAPGAALAQTAAGRSVRAPVKPAFPALRLEEKSNGEQAVARLGAHLPAVAAHYGKSASEFSRQLRTDRSAWVDKSGRLVFIEQGLTSSGSDLAVSNVIYPPEQTFVLHSRPGSKRKIYLDFNGHTTTGSAWNTSYARDPIVSPAFDLDGVPGTFNTNELALIQNVWRRVAEDYAPFDVDVTTEQPSVDQMTRVSSTDDTYGARALITKNFTVGSNKGNCNCGGFAYVGVFDHTVETYKTAFIFQDMLGNSEKNIAEAVSHEVGHNLGLSHDGTATLGYYSGHGSGATGWAPIMGVGYSKELVQFSKGEYTGANNKEDDFLVMQSNGVLFAADDFGNTMGTARALSPTDLNGMSSYTINGVVETPLDTDVFSLRAAAGTVTINATPFQRSPNLDILITLRDAAGAVLAQANPAALLSSAISIAVPAGQYYLSIQGAANGNPQGTGYSSYGSIGRYTMTVSAPTASTPLLAMHVETITMALGTGSRAGESYAQAGVAVKDSNGRVIAGATVSGNWSGIVAGAAVATTNAAGVAFASSPLVKSGGTFTYTVTGISAPGYAYEPVYNRLGSNAITR